MSDTLIFLNNLVRHLAPYTDDDNNYESDDDFFVAEAVGSNVDDAFGCGVTQGEYNIASHVTGLVLAYQNRGELPKIG